MKKFGKPMVHNLDVLSSNGYFQFFCFELKIMESVTSHKHASFTLVFQIGPLQKILIIIVCLCWIQNYSHTLVQSV